MPRRIQFTRIVSRTQDVASDLGRLQFSQFHSQSATWQPAVNAYRYEDGFEICVELAGVDKDAIAIHAEPTLITISGERLSPRPNCGEPGAACRQTLAMEIENGPFERQIALPTPIDTGQITARQENGLLWISLPERPEQDA